MATTIDQIIAGKIGQETALPSLEVASETTTQVAACPSGAGCYYSTTLSFRNPTSPLPMEFNPRKVFTQLFGEGDTPEERDAIAAETKSLLDLISDRTAALQKSLGPSDRRVLDDYLDTVREIERRVAKAEQRDLTGLTLPEAPIGELDKFDEQVKLMFDLIALAYQANLTRVASYIMVAEGTNRTYNHIGISDAFHPLSHHANDKERLAEAREDPDVPRAALRGLRREDRGDSRRRRLAARPLLVHVRLEHEQQRPAQQLSAAEHPRRRRERRAQGRPARRAARAHDAHEPASHGAQQGRARAQELLGQHRRDRGRLSLPMLAR